MNTPGITITITPNDKGNPPLKLADAELQFTDGLLAGLRLIGFAVWQGKGGQRNVTFPARSYSVNGDRRVFALLRPQEGAPDTYQAQETVRLAVLAAYSAWEYRPEARNQGAITPSAVAARQAAASSAPVPTLTVSPGAQAALDQVAADLETRQAAAPAQDDWTF